MFDHLHQNMELQRIVRRINKQGKKKFCENNRIYIQLIIIHLCLFQNLMVFSTITVKAHFSHYFLIYNKFSILLLMPFHSFQHNSNPIGDNFLIVMCDQLSGTPVELQTNSVGINGGCHSLLQAPVKAHDLMTTCGMLTVKNKMAV